MFFHNFLLQAEKENPDKIAIIYKDTEWTYKELKQYAEKFAQHLKDLSLNIGDRVILQFEPCPQAIALEIACSMAGLVFIPVSPDSPMERLFDIISSVEPKLYLGNLEREKLIQFNNMHHGNVKNNELVIEYNDNDINKSQLRIKGRLLETDLVYIIFTSGTTGRPKGIMMSHLAVVSFFKGMVSTCKSISGIVGSIAPIQFDFSILDMGLAFGNSATLVLVPKLLVHHPQRFIQYLNKHNISLMSGVPSIWKPLLNSITENEKLDIPKLDSILYAGEPFLKSDLLKLKNSLPNLSRIINCFGQSESIACTFNDIYDDLDEYVENISIGSAQLGSELYLIDENGLLITEPNKVGELYLRGPLLFSGYWKDNERTSKVLITNPLNPVNNDRVFKTGDLAYYGNNEELYYIGRSDNRVNILGNRVELDEISQCISKFPGVSQVEIIFSEKDISRTKIFAYITLTDSFNEDINNIERELREHLAKSLPLYMLPSHYIILKQFPTNVNGKLNKSKLISYSKSLLKGDLSNE